MKQEVKTNLIEMDNKYYTPTIEEFHVGFEYYFSSAYQEGISTTEIEIEGREGYEPEVFNFDIYNYIPNKGESWKDIFKSMLDHGQMKVKYLDKDDIESLGWVIGQSRYTKGEYRLQQHANPDIKQVRIWTETSNVGYSDTIFDGIIKNKSELKVLLKQLNIK